MIGATRLNQARVFSIVATVKVLLVERVSLAMQSSMRRESIVAGFPLRHPPVTQHSSTRLPESLVEL